MNETQLNLLAKRFPNGLRLNEPIASHTSFRIGGIADAFVAARSRQDLVDAVRLAETLDLPWIVVGRGSNILIDDAGFRGLVIRNETNLVTLDRRIGSVVCESGARLPTIGAQTAKAGLGGFEWAVGIPGSVGGGVVMNAGAHGGCVADCLIGADVLVRGNPDVWIPEKFNFAYRSSSLQNRRDVIVLAATFSLTPGEPAASLAKIQSYREHRRETQPTDPGAGSIFRNPPGQSAGALIDRARLKGTQRGGAIISPKHGNFIVNLGGATSANVLDLISLARETISQRFGIDLEPEIELIGPAGRLSRAGQTGLVAPG